MSAHGILRILDKLECYVGQFLLVFFICLIFTQTVLRSLFSIVIPWSEEASRFAFVWFVFFGAAYAARLAAHNRVTIQFRPFPQWVGDACMLLGDAAWLVFNTVMVVESLEVIQELREFPYATPALDWQLSSIYFIFPIAFTLISIRVIQVNIMKFVLKKAIPSPEKAAVEQAFPDGDVRV